MHAWFTYNSLFRAIVALQRGRIDIAEFYLKEVSGA